MTEAEKEFERADIANAEKRAKELVDWADQYKSALRELALAKVDLKRIVDSAKEKGFSKNMLEAVVFGQLVSGVDKMAFLNAINNETTSDAVEESEENDNTEEPENDKGEENDSERI